MRPTVRYCPTGPQAIVEPQSNPAPNFALNNQIKPISTPSQGQPQTLPINNKPSDNAVASTTGGPAENTAKQLPAPQPQNAAKADEVKASDIDKPEDAKHLRKNQFRAARG
jgi:hypothetical protein